jgi:uncharacterized protein
MRRDRSADLLQDILDFIDRIENWTSSELEASHIDEKTLYAVLHALQYIGEAVSRLPNEVIDLAPQIPWAKIRAMRNVIAHDYAGIDTAVVWETVKQRLPKVRTARRDHLAAVAS